MRASNAHSVRPEDQDHRRRSAALQVGRDDDQQRDRRDHEEDVGREVDERRRPSRRSRRRGCRGVAASAVASVAAAAPEEERGARAPDDLREDVGALIGRAEEVVPATGAAWRRAASRRSGRASRSAARRPRPATIAVSTIRPKRDFGFASSSRSHSGIAEQPAPARARAAAGRRAGRTLALGAARRAATGWICDTVRLARPHARVEDEVQDVHDEVRDDHAHREDQQQALRERVVAAERGLLRASSPRPGS